jgi:hypothetical protein
MDVTDYCNNVGIELTAWKAKLYDMIRKIDGLSSGDKEKMLGNIGDLHNIVTELEDRIGSLKTECPTEWSPQKKEIDDAHIDMRSKYEEAMEAIGKAAPVSVPG